MTTLTLTLSSPLGGPRLRLPPPEDLVHALAMAAGFVQHLLDSNPDLIAAVAAGKQLLLRFRSCPSLEIPDDNTCR